MRAASVRLALRILTPVFSSAVDIDFTLLFDGGGPAPRRFATLGGRPRRSSEPTGSSAGGFAPLRESRRYSGANFSCRCSAAPSSRLCARNSFLRGLPVRLRLRRAGIWARKLASLYN